MGRNDSEARIRFCAFIVPSVVVMPALAAPPSRTNASLLLFCVHRNANTAVRPIMIQ